MDNDKSISLLEVLQCENLVLNILIAKLKESYDRSQEELKSKNARISYLENVIRCSGRRL